MDTWHQGKHDLGEKVRHLVEGKVDHEAWVPQRRSTAYREETSPVLSEQKWYGTQICLLRVCSAQRAVLVGITTKHHTSGNVFTSDGGDF